MVNQYKRRMIARIAGDARIAQICNQRLSAILALCSFLITKIALRTLAAKPFEKEVSIAEIHAQLASLLSVSHADMVAMQKYIRHRQRNDRLQIEQDSFPFDATIIGHKFVRSLFASPAISAITWKPGFIKTHGSKVI